MSDPGKTTAVVLVAGRGSRLSRINSNRPKCLASVDGVSILERLFSALADCGVGGAVLVVGYQHEGVKEAVSNIATRLPVRFALNTGFLATGTARSLRIGLSAVDPGNSVVVIEGDVLFDPAILRAVLSRSAVATTALARWRPEHTGSCAVVENGRVVSWIHESRRPPAFAPDLHYKTVNITWLSSSAWRTALLPTIEEALREDGELAPVEYAFHRFVASRSHPVEGVLADEWKWWEVDTPEDLQIALQLFSGQLAPAMTKGLPICVESREPSH